MNYELISERNFFRSPGANLILKCTIVGIFNKLKLDQALEELKRVNPILACIFKQDDEWRVTLVENTDKYTIKMIKKENDNQWIKDMEEEDKIPFSFDNEPPIRFFIYYGEQDFDFVVLGHHILGDGLSYVNLFGDFLEIYCNNNKSLSVKETKFIKNSDDLPADSILDSTTLEEIKSMNEEWVNYKRVFTQEEFDNMYQQYHDYKSTSMCEYRLTKEQFGTMIKNCKLHNVTINTAICTAYLYALREDVEKLNIAVNLRDKINFQPGKCIGNYAAAVGPVFRYDFEVDFWENAKRIGSVVKEELKDTEKLFRIMQVFCLLDGTIFDASFMGMLMKCNVDFLIKMSRALRLDNQIDMTNISNLGAVSLPARFNDYQVKGFSYFAPITSATNKTLSAITIGDDMAIGFSYVKQKYTEEEATLLVKNLVDILCHE